MRERVRLAPLAVLLIQAVVAFPTLFKSVPLTSGWFFAIAHEAQSRTAYRDFYVHMPPGSILFEGIIPNLFANPFVGHDVSHLVYWMVFSLFLYLLVAHLSTPLIGIMISSLVSITYYAQPGNIVSGYFETSLMFQLAGLYFMLRWLEGSRWIPLVSGICFGLSLTVRGSAALFVASLLITAIFISFASPTSRFRRPLQWVAVGVLIPWGFVGAWSLISDNTVELLTQITDTSAKAGWIGASQIMAGSVLSLPMNLYLIALIVLILGISGDLADSPNSLRQSVSILAFMALLSLSFGFLPGGTEPQRLEPILLLLGAGSFVVLNRVKQLQVIRRYSEASELLVTFCFVLVIVGAWQIELRDIPETTFPEINWKDALGFSSAFSLNAKQLGLFGVLATLVRPDFVTCKVDAKLVRLIAFSVVCQRYVDSVAGGSTVETWSIGIALGLIILVNLLRSSYPSVTTAAFLFTALAAVAGLVVSQNAVPYDWAGVKVVSLSSDRRVLYGHGLVRFSVEQNDAAFFDEVFSAIEVHGIRNSQTFFSMRNAGMSRWFDVPMYPTACVVIWFDVCPEQFAEETYNQIVKDPPEFALISIESVDDVINPNEQTWGDGGDSYQRKIQDFFNPQLNSGRYEILAQHEPSATQSAASPTTFLLRLKNI